MRLQDPFAIFRVYCGIKMHFTSERYDFVKYRGKHNASTKAFQARKDIAFFNWLSSRLHQEDTIPFFVSQFIDGPAHQWIGDVAFEKEAANERYTEWRKRMARMTDRYQEDMRLLAADCGSWNNVFSTKEGHPRIFILVSRKQIAPETYSLLHMYTRFIDICEEKLAGDPVFATLNLKYRKYVSFLKLDPKKFVEITPKSLEFV